ncbi:hypothetical protein DEU39_3588 [Chryseobacterium sp. AG363]|nr:hypothetical protein DEU39_3588 [Chryseobacterium sp. AG363]
MSYEIESFEGYASNALPTGIIFLTEVFHQRYLKNLFISNVRSATLPEIRMEWLFLLSNRKNKLSGKTASW